MIKSVKRLTLALAVAGIIFTPWFAQPLAAQEYVKLDGQAKQEYMAQSLAPFFHPAAKKTATPKPFAAPEGYTYSQKSVDGVKYEQLTPLKKKTDKVLLQMHGGAYILPLRNSYRAFGVKQSRLAGGAEVFMLDYRVAPEYHHPAALEDAVALYNHLLAQGYKSENIIFIGDSAGGNLVLATSLYLRDHNIPQPGALIMISPWAAVGNTLPSRVYNYKKDLILGEDASPLVPEVLHSRYAEGSSEQDAYLSPLYADNFKKLPPMLIQAGSYETLFDDSALIAARAREDGVKVQFSVYAGMPHDFALMLPQMQDSQDSFKEIQKFIKEL